MFWKKCWKSSKNSDDLEHLCSLEPEDSKSFLPPLPLDATCFDKFRRAFKKCTLISEKNPQSAEYYRSRPEILRLRREHIQSGSFIIHPFSDFRTHYEIWRCFVLFASIWYLPAYAAFDMLSYDIGFDDVVFVLLQLTMMSDVILTFFTGYAVRKKRKVIMKQSKIAKNYILSIYFVTDLIVALPITFAMNLRTMKYYNVCCFLRILRLPTLARYLSQSIEYFHLRNFYTDLVKNVIVHYLVFHYFACVQYLFAALRFMADGRMVVNSWENESNLENLNIVRKYIVCFYRAVGKLFCVVIDQTPIPSDDKLVSILTYIFGKIYIFYLSVLILNYLLRQRSLEIKYFETISQVQAYMSQRQIPVNTQKKLLQLYDYKYNKKFFKDQGITGLLSERLRAEISLNTCKLLQKVALLSDLPPQLLDQVVLSLKREIYLANDFIIKAGSVGDCMYFLANGTVAVWTPSGKEVCHLQDGAYFGEISLVFKDKRRTATIIAIEICEVYKLDRKTFKNCFKTNSDLYRMLETVATERMEITNMFEEVHAKTFLELSDRTGQI